MILSTDCLIWKMGNWAGVKRPGESPDLFGRSFIFPGSAGHAERLVKVN
jgi:hypothetical protein